MPRYVVFGGCLESPLSFPQLPEASPDVPASWTIVKTSSARRLENVELLGTHAITSASTVHLYRHGEGLRLEYDDSGTFDVSLDGATIVWAPRSSAEDVNVREDVLGPVLAAAMHLRGRFCLHGSSVVLAGGAIAFLAPKHHGKSTLAMAAIAGGAKLLTDDSLPVEPGPPVMAWPGVASVRFWDDIRVRFHGNGKTVEGAGGKHAAIDLACKSQLRTPQRLRGIYLLAPFNASEHRAPVERERVTGIESALSLVRHAKIGTLLGKSESAIVLHRAAAIAAEVPVYVLRIERNLERLQGVISQLFAWHAHDQPGP
jgi:hypothetical protein